MSYIDWKQELTTVKKGPLTGRILGNILKRLELDAQDESRQIFFDATPKGFGKVIRKKIIEAINERGISVDNLVFPKAQILDGDNGNIDYIIDVPGDAARCMFEDKFHLFPAKHPIYAVKAYIRKEALGFFEKEKGKGKGKPSQVYIEIGHAYPHNDNYEP